MWRLGHSRHIRDVCAMSASLPTRKFCCLAANDVQGQKATFTIIFASFSLFADNNATTIVALCIMALSASAAIFLILELGQPFTGLMRISSEPLRNALAPLSP